MKTKKELNTPHEKVLFLIRKGKENKVNLKYISDLTNISVRAVKYIINELREYFPICSTTLEGGGYWIADCNKDIVDFIKHEEKLIKAHKRNINFMEGHIK